MFAYLSITRHNADIDSQIISHTGERVFTEDKNQEGVTWHKYHEG